MSKKEKESKIRVTVVGELSEDTDWNEVERKLEDLKKQKGKG